jgi:hypothetical protein
VLCLVAEVDPQRLHPLLVPLLLRDQRLVQIDAWGGPLGPRVLQGGAKEGPAVPVEERQAVEGGVDQFPCRGRLIRSRASGSCRSCSV